MRKVVPALAAVLIATVGAVSAAQAELINFGVVITPSADITYAGPSLDASTSIDFDLATLTVTGTAKFDVSGLAAGDTVTYNPTFIDYGSTPTGDGLDITIPTFTKSWTATTDVNGTPVGDVFTEELTTLDSINRTSANAITFQLSGTVTDSDGVFPAGGAPAFLILTANQVGGPGTVITASFTNTSRIGEIPEPSTWVMLALGFAGLGYAAVRRSAKDKAAIAV